MAETITNVSVGIVTGNRTKIDSATVKNGRIYFSKDTGELFYDWNGTRVQVCPQTTPNNATLSIKANGTDVSTFTANSSINRSIDISAGSNITISGTASTGKIVISGTADTKNTAGATVTDNSIYLVGPTTTGSASAQTYANASVYMRAGKLYSDKKVVATESFVTGKGYQTAANVASAIDTSINTLNSSVPVTSNQAVAGFEEVNGKITNVTKVTIPTVSYPVTSVAGKTGAVDLDDLNIGTKPSSSGTATNRVAYDGNGAKGLYFSSANPTTTNVQFAVDTNGFVTGTVSDSGDTWRGVYTGGTSRVGTGTSTKAINYVGANGITVSYLAAGTGSGQSGSTNYFNVSVGHTNSITAGDVSATISGTTLTIPKISYDAQGHITTVTSGTVTTQDTKNTTGSSSSTGKLYIVGAGSQNSTGVQTYSNANVYTQNGSLYATGMYEGTKRVATQEYVDGLVANATHYKGTFNATNGKINGGSTTLTSVAEKVGDLYKCDASGTYLSTAYEVGDSIYFIKDVAASTAPVATDITSIEGTVSVSVPSTVPTIGTADTTLGTVEGVVIKAKVDHTASSTTAGTYRSVTVNSAGHVTSGSNPTTLAGYGITDAQPKDADLTAIAGLTGTSGFLKKTGADTWSLDTNTYATTSQIPTVNNAKLTIKQNGSELGSFTANQGTDVSVNITVPTIPNNFETIAVTSNSSTVNVVADSSKDTVTFTAGTGISLSANANSDTITITNTVSNSDTKNTAGNSTSNSTVYLVGPTSTSSGATSYAQTYANASVYMTAGKLYSDKKVVLNSADLTNINSSIDRLDTSVNILNSSVAEALDKNLKILNLTFTSGYEPSTNNVDSWVDLGSTKALAAAKMGITETEYTQLLNGYYDIVTWYDASTYQVDMGGTIMTVPKDYTNVQYIAYKNINLNSSTAGVSTGICYFVPCYEMDTVKYSGSKYLTLSFLYDPYGGSGGTASYGYRYDNLHIPVASVPEEIIDCSYGDEVLFSHILSIYWSKDNVKDFVCRYGNRIYHLIGYAGSTSATFVCLDGQLDNGLQKTVYWVHAQSHPAVWTNGSYTLASQEWVNSSLANYSKGNSEIYKGTCSTGATTAAKVVTCSAFTSAKLVKGAIIFVTFDYTNTASVSSITMNVNSTGAKPIKKIWMNAVSNLNNNQELQANETYIFQYDGTNWVCMNCDWTYTYSKISTAEIDSLSTGNNWCIDGSLLKYAVDKWAPNPDLTNYVTTSQYNTNMPNNFSGVYVWATPTTASNASINVSPDSSKDVLTFKAGTNVALTGDATNDIITINAVDTTYSAGDGISINSTNNQISAAANIKVKVGDSSFLVPIGGNNPGILDISAGPNVTITPDVNAKRITVAASGFVQGDGISIIKAITQSAYEALPAKDPSTVYIVTADLN